MSNVIEDLNISRILDNITSPSYLFEVNEVNIGQYKYLYSCSITISILFICIQWLPSIASWYFYFWTSNFPLTTLLCIYSSNNSPKWPKIWIQKMLINGPIWSLWVCAIFQKKVSCSISYEIWPATNLG